MTTIVAVHSYSGGTGRSSVVANLASLLALQNKKIGVLDANLQAPGLGVFYGLNREQVTRTYNDYLRGSCAAKDIAYPARNALENAETAGSIYVIPASTRSEEIAAVLAEGYDVDLLQESFYALDDALDLDLLLIDVQAGINEEIVNIVGILDHLILLLCPGEQDYLGTATIANLAENLEVIDTILVANKVLPEADLEVLKQTVDEICQHTLDYALPFSMELLRAADKTLFCQQYPDSPFTSVLQQIAHQISE